MTLITHSLWSGVAKVRNGELEFGAVVAEDKSTRPTVVLQKVCEEWGVRSVRSEGVWGVRDFASLRVQYCLCAYITSKCHRVHLAECEVSRKVCVLWHLPTIGVLAVLTLLLKAVNFCWHQWHSLVLTSHTHTTVFSCQWLASAPGVMGVWTWKNMNYVSEIKPTIILIL